MGTYTLHKNTFYYFEKFYLYLIGLLIVTKCKNMQKIYIHLPSIWEDRRRRKLGNTVVSGKSETF